MPKPPQDRQSAPSNAGATEAVTAPAIPPRYEAETLFAGARQLIIVHGEREYCLRLTATNKLILTA